MRETVTVMDVLSDIGGFAEVLAFTCGFFINILNHKYLDSVLVSKLFRVKDPRGINKHGKAIKARRSGYCLEVIINFFRCKCLCPTEIKNHKVKRLAIKTLREEIDFVQLIRM